MSRSVNKVFILGYLGQDPEQRTTDSGTAVTNFSVATTEEWKDKAGEKQEKTEWHNIVAWKKLAEICGQYLKKGSRVHIEGKLTTQSWEKEGVKHYKTVIVADQLVMLSASGEATTHASAADKDDDSALPF